MLSCSELFQRTAANLAVAIVAGSVAAQDQNLIDNPAFLDADLDGFADGWGAFGAAAIDLDFFGDGTPGHGTLFADQLNNIGGVFLAGIPATPGTEYTLSVRIQWESMWDARTLIGFEYYDADDATQLGFDITEIENEPTGEGYRRYDVTAAAPAGTVFIRPVVIIDDVQSGGEMRAATVDNFVLREADGGLTLNPSFGDLVDDGNNGDFWASFGAVAFDLDFNNNGNPGHATFFADDPMNAGFMWQPSISATPGETYTFEVDLAFEENWAADTFIAIEYYGADDGFLISKDETEVVESPGGGYETFTITSQAPDSPFVTFVRPLVRYENVVGGAGELESATIDNGTLRTGLPVPTRLCADVNGDGQLLADDFNTWLTAFLGESPIADQNNDGQLLADDFNTWLTNFLAGENGPSCPG
ncbi:MAG: GC-type dockerin domain-anchored protein [Planctomycetota bacterium]